MPRRRNARVTALGMLRVTRHDLLLLVDRWRVSGLVELAAGETHPDQVATSNGLARPRKPWEYPENDIAEWRRLRRDLGHAAQQLADLDQLAAEQIELLRCRVCGSDLPSDEARAGFTTCEHCPAPNRETVP